MKKYEEIKFALLTSLIISGFLLEEKLLFIINASWVIVAMPIFITYFVIWLVTFVNMMYKVIFGD